MRSRGRSKTRDALVPSVTGKSSNPPTRNCSTHGSFLNQQHRRVMHSMYKTSLYHACFNSVRTKILCRSTWRATKHFFTFNTTYPDAALLALLTKEYSAFYCDVILKHGLCAYIVSKTITQPLNTGWWKVPFFWHQSSLLPNVCKSLCS